MQVIYSDCEIPEGDPTYGGSYIVENSIFLAGPTPRDAKTPSWRPEALKYLEKLGFDGTVFIPEYSSESDYDYDKQVEWEWEALHKCDVIVFWIPRDLDKLPGFTTNVEFGFYLANSESAILYGRPDDSPKNKYLDWLYDKITGEKPYNSLEAIMKEAYRILNQ